LCAASRRSALNLFTRETGSGNAEDRPHLAGGEDVEGAEAGGEFGGGQAAPAVVAAGGSLWLHPAPIGCLPVFAISFPSNPFDA